jgi:hypothetical protein
MAADDAVGDDAVGLPQLDFDRGAQRERVEGLDEDASGRDVDAQRPDLAVLGGPNHDGTEDAPPRCLAVFGDSRFHVYLPEFLYTTVIQ